MPSFYAHYKFGQDLLRNFKFKLSDVINYDNLSYRLFIIGLQGPDILSYYKPYKNNNLNIQSKLIHHSSGKSYFKKVVHNIQNNPHPYNYSYLYGSICHYILYSSCHPTIIKNTSTSNTHANIEKYFDLLLINKNIKPIDKHIINNSVPTEKALSAYIKPFYSNIDPKYIKSSVLSMNRYLKIIYTSPITIRKTIFKLLDNSRELNKKADLIFLDENPKIYDDYFYEINTIYNSSLHLMVNILEDLYENKNFDILNNSIFEKNFLGQLC